jgi:signal transduction histidine kinase/ActR/RegA family two-component response regulator
MGPETVARARSSISRRITVLVLATTVTALALSALGLVAYDLHAYQQQWTRSLDLQAEILARASAPALSFNDPQTAQKDLSIIRVREAVLVAAIYTDDGRLFASYVRPGQTADGIPEHPQADGFRITGDQIAVFHRVVESGEPLGTIYIRATYLPWSRLGDYLTILGVVMVASLVLAALILGWLQRGITAPILEVAGVARRVMGQRDYSVRARKTTDDEIGELVDAFNGMLAEVERRTEALHDADRRKDEFLATLAHELRNPLAPIRNAVQILRTPGSPPDMSQRALEMMERQLRQMVRLVDDLLDVSRITTGRLGVQRTPFDVREAVAGAVEMTRPFIASRSHAFEVEVDPQPLMVDGDSTRLAQVIGNLLNNAAKYTEPGGRISLTVAREDRDAVIRVADNGVGIAPESLAGIFDMFVQVGQSPGRVQTGLGVGLTLVRQLVELHGGTVTARSDGLGKGSEFAVRLPLAGEGASRPDREAGGDEPPVPRRRVLVADDNVDFAASLCAVLEAQGHDVRAVHDGVDALAAMQAFLPEFAFLDLGMPKLHGYARARRLRRDPRTAGCFIVALTGGGREDDRHRSKEAGFDTHLVKPVDPARIEEILRGVSPPVPPRPKALAPR